MNNEKSSKAAENRSRESMFVQEGQKSYKVVDFYEIFGQY
jgi:hypothetical protein